MLYKNALCEHCKQETTFSSHWSGDPLKCKTAIVERSLTQEHISAKDATKMLNMMQQPARLLFHKKMEQRNW